MNRNAIPTPKTEFARKRRSAATRIERDLWHQLRAKRVDGWKFRREAPIGPYVVDFVCFEARLVVEADGPLHQSSEQRKADQLRESWLEGAGFRVLRFAEGEVLSDLGRVLDRVRSALSEASPPPGRLRRPPSPSWGEGLPKRPLHKVLIIACGALAREINAIIEANGLSYIALTCLPAIWHNRPEKIAPAVRALIRENRERYRRILIGYAECGTQGQLDKVCAEEGVERIAGPHCYAFYSGTEAFLARGDADMDAFYLTDFIARQFDSFVIEPLGLDRHPELRDAYFGNYRRLVYLAQSEDPELDTKARDAAKQLGLAYEKRVTGYGDLRAFLTKSAPAEPTATTRAVPAE